MSMFKVSRVGEPDVLVSTEDPFDPEVEPGGVLRVGRSYFAPGVWTSCLELNPVVDYV